MAFAETVIGRFGGQSALARLIGKRQSTVQHWAKSGSIPAKWQPQLLLLARERGIDLSPADFLSGSAHSHVVQFYDSDSFLVDSVARYVGSAFESGNAAVVITTKSRRERLADCLSRRGFDLAGAVRAGTYIALDAGVTLSKFMVAGRPDGARFEAVLKPLIERANRASRCKYPRTSYFGQMVALLWRDGEREAAIQLEQLWNDLARSCDFSLICAYPMDLFSRQDQGQGFVDVCGQHSDVIPTESYSALTAESERRRTIARLQQRTQALDAEVRRAKEQLAFFQTIPSMGSFEIDLAHDSIALSPQAQKMLGVGGRHIALPEFLQVMDYSADQRAFAVLVKRARTGRKEFRGTFRIKSQHHIRTLRSYGKVLSNAGEPMILGVFQEATPSEASKLKLPLH